MVTLSNNELVVVIKEQGAELTSIKERKNNYEYLWQGDADYWGRQAPVLFPIVGRLKNQTYYYQGDAYQLSQHGFARDMTFTIQKVTENSATFNLKSTPETLKHYPFNFSLQITYILHDRQITVSYELLNTDNKVLYYSIGGHPGFNVSTKTKADGSKEFQDVFLSFEPNSKYLRIPLNDEGLTKRRHERYEAIDDKRLNYEDFAQDALIYQINRRTSVRLIDEHEGFEIKLKSGSMPFVGIWTPYPKQADFICIEPWAGIADDELSDQNFTTKYGSHSLKPAELKMHDYTLDFKRLD